MLKNLNFTAACLAILLLQISPLQAAVENVSNLEAAGYALMDDINTPLLHTVATGAGYDLRVLAWATGEVSARMPGLDKSVRTKAASEDEFDRQDVSVSWGSFITSREQILKSAHGYLIPLRTNWREYNFSTHHYRAEFTMRGERKRSKSSFHCDGAFQEVKHEYLTSCLTATNLNAGESWLHSFPIDDVLLARQIKESPDRFRVYAVAVPNGKYQTMRGRDIVFLTRNFNALIAAGVQPVKIVNLALVDRNSGEIYAFSRSFELTTSGLPTQSGVNAKSNSLGQQSAASGTENIPAPATRWSKYFADANVTLYADLDSIKRDGDVVVVREMEDLTKVGTNRIASTVGIYSYNCAKRSWRSLNEKSYADHMGVGVVVTESAEAKNMGVVMQENVSVHALNNACNAPSVAK
jgi:hypothetical protein